MSSERFLILCLARTGSSHLVDLLDSHPAIRCYGEVLNETHPKAAPSGWIGDSDAPDAIAHVERLLGERPPGIAAVGFKLPINSIRDHPEIADWVVAERGGGIVRLRRRNLLELLVSRRMLQATLVSQSVDGSYGDASVRIEPRAALRALERIEAEETELDRLAAGHPEVAIDYEELAAPEALERVQQFLGVGPAPLRSRYEKLRTRSLAETVENWDELAARLRRSRYAPLLAESAGNE